MSKQAELGRKAKHRFMDTIEQQLKTVRPALRRVAPLTHAICWGYAVVNIGLGLGLLLIFETRTPIAVANVLSYQQWGIVFLLLGIYTAYALLANKWSSAKKAQLFGLMVKAVWAIALAFRTFEAPSTIIVTLIWLFFAFIQAAVYVYFLPTDLMQGERER